MNRLLLDMVIACDHNVSVLNNLATYERLERGGVLSPEDVRVYDFVQNLFDVIKIRLELDERF